jgi:predicted dehydrogenase
MTLRIGILGCGRMGRRRAHGIHACGDRVRRVYDVDPARADELAGESGARPARCVEELLGGVDAVVVATPNSALAPHVARCLDQRLPVLVEKPGATDAAALDLLVRTAAKHAVPLQVGYSLVHYPAVRAFLDAAADLGEPLHLRAAYGHGGRPGMDREWRADPRLAGGGELLDQGVHLIHLSTLLLGQVATVKSLLSAKAWGLPVEDTAALLLSHARGAAVLTASWSFWRNEFRLDYTARRGSVHLCGLGGSYGDGRLVRHRRRPDVAGAPVTDELAVPAGDPWDREWLDFREVVRGGGPGNGELAVSVLRVIEEARADG